MVVDRIVADSVAIYNNAMADTGGGREFEVSTESRSNDSRNANEKTVGNRLEDV